VDFFYFFLLFSPIEEAPTKEMEVEVEENGASAGRGEVFQGREGGAEMEVEDGEDGGTDAAPARPASADAIKQMMLAHERGHQAHGGVPGGGSTDDAAGSGSEGQQGSGTHHVGIRQSRSFSHVGIRQSRSFNLL